jgi:thioesterase domain-containing protein
MAELVRAGGLPASVQVVNLAGEALTAQLASSVYASQPAVREVVNLYGPTEDTTYSTWAVVPREAGAGREPTIGRPVANTRAYALDAHLEPAPQGVPGELYIGGAGLARGYLNAPALTAERFIPDAFSAGPGARLYKTGDLVRYLPDGQIEFLGRIDHQVKVRGFRIELGEVETNLAGCAGVRESAVVGDEDVHGSTRLVAYVVPHEDAAPTAGELRRSLSLALPEYMVPSLFVMMDSLPRTPNGKVDRRALPAPDATDATRADNYVAPQTPAEEIVASIFAEVLGVERVGASDNFFEMGGHSLLATRAMARVVKVFQVGVGLRRLFERPTVQGVVEALSEEWGGPEVVEEIAKTFMEAGELLNRMGSSASIALDAPPRPNGKGNSSRLPAPGEMPLPFLEGITVEGMSGLLRQEDGAQSWSPLVTIQKGSMKQPLFCVHAAGGSVFCYLDLARHLDRDQPVYGLQAGGMDATQGPHKRIEDMAAEYIKAVREVQPEGPYFLCGWSMGGVIAFEMTHQLQSQSEQVSFLGLIDSVSPTHRQVTPDESDELVSIINFARDLGLSAYHMTTPREELSQMNAEELLNHLGEQAKSADLIPEHLNLTQLKGLYHVFRTNVNAFRQYEPCAKARRITLLLSEDSASYFPDSTLGWGDFSIEEIEVFTIPGNHYSIVRKPSVEIVARQLKGCLDKLRRSARLIF